MCRGLPSGAEFPAMIFFQVVQRVQPSSTVNGLCLQCCRRVTIAITPTAPYKLHKYAASLVADSVINMYALLADNGSARVAFLGS